MLSGSPETKTEKNAGRSAGRTSRYSFASHWLAAGAACGACSAVVAAVSAAAGFGAAFCLAALAFVFPFAFDFAVFFVFAFAFSALAIQVSYRLSPVLLKFAKPNRIRNGKGETQVEPAVKSVKEQLRAQSRGVVDVALHVPAIADIHCFAL